MLPLLLSLVLLDAAVEGGGGGGILGPRAAGAGGGSIVARYVALVSDRSIDRRGGANAPGPLLGLIARNSLPVEERESVAKCVRSGGWL